GVEYGTDKKLTCMKIITPATTYDQATSLCADSGGYLASVKTVDKLAMVVSLAQGNNLWIGLDDQATEGVYVWQQDFTHLTSTQINDTFTKGEPNNGWNVEDCVHFRGNTGRLNDQHCWDNMLGLCETLPIESTC
ncbi:C-type lectin, partial [Plakobranchus ocellatus]